MRRMLIAGIALVMVLAACGSSSKKSSPPSTTTPTTMSKSAAEALAKGAVLTASDAPDGFTAVPHSSSGDLPEQLKRDFAACMHTDVTLFDDPAGSATADGPDLKNANTGAEIDNSITIVPTKADVDKGYQSFDNPDVETCLAKLFDAGIKEELATDSSLKDAEFGKVTVDSFAVNGVGDRGKGFRVTLPFAVEGEQHTLFLDILFVQRGNDELTIQSQGIDKQPDRDQAIALLKKMNDRLGVGSSSDTTTP